MDALVAAILISAILDLVTAQALYGYQPYLYRHASFVDPNLRQGALDQLNAKWRLTHLDYLPKNINYPPQPLQTGISDRVVSGWKHGHIGNNGLESGNSIGSNNLRREIIGNKNGVSSSALGVANKESYSHVSNNYQPYLSQRSSRLYHRENGFKDGHLVDIEPELDGELNTIPAIENSELTSDHSNKQESHRRFSINSNYNEHTTQLKNKQLQMNNEKENGITNKPLIHQNEEDNDISIMYDNNSQLSGDDLKHIESRKQVNTDIKNSVLPDNGPKQLLSEKNYKDLDNIKLYKEEHGDKHITSTSNHQRHSKYSHSVSSNRIEPAHELFDGIRRSQKYEIEKRNNEEAKKFILPVERNTADVEDLYTEISKNKLGAILDLIKNPEKIKFQQHNNFDRELIERNEDIVTKFIIEHFTPDEIQHLISYAKTGEENKKVIMALENYKMITKALLDFIHYSNPLNGHIQSLKIISEYRRPGSDVVTSTLNEVFSEYKNNLAVEHFDDDEYKKPLIDKVEISRELVEKPSLEVPEGKNENEINNIAILKVINNRRTVEAQKREHVQHNSKEDQVDCKGNIEGLSEIQKADCNKNIASENQKEGNNVIIENVDEVERTENNENRKEVPEVAGNNENIESLSKIRRAGNIENIVVPSDSQVIVHEIHEVNHNHTKKEYSVNTHNNGVEKVDEVKRTEDNENIKEVPEVAGDSDNIESLSKIRRAGNIKNIKIPSDSQVIVNEIHKVKHNHTKKEYLINNVTPNPEDNIEGNHKKTKNLNNTELFLQNLEILKRANPEDDIERNHKKFKNSNNTELEIFMQNLQIHKKFENAFCEKLNTEQGINVMESILTTFIEDLLHTFDKEVVLKTAENSVNRNLNAERDGQDCYEY